MPTDPAANAAASKGVSAVSGTSAAAPVAGAERPRSNSRWSWLGYSREGSEALAKVAPPPPRLSDKPDPATLLGADAEPARDSDQQGLASWYGPGFHGRRTASGERFDSGELTAAHRSLAFGTRVCVRSSVTGKTVVVRINDRGPFSKGRVIDLSQAAAEELGMMGLGIKPVELWALASDEGNCPGDQMDVDEDPMLAGLHEGAHDAVRQHAMLGKTPVRHKAHEAAQKKK